MPNNWITHVQRNISPYMDTYIIRASGFLKEGISLPAIGSENPGNAMSNHVLYLGGGNMQSMERTSD